MAWLHSSGFIRKLSAPAAPAAGAVAEDLLNRLLAAERAMVHGAYYDARCLLSEAELRVLEMQQKCLELMERNAWLERRLEEQTRRRTA